MNTTRPDVVDKPPQPKLAVMRAACLTSFTGLDGLRVTDVAVPEPGRDDVLIAVRTVGANQLDLNTMRGRGPGTETPLPLVLGIDPAGTVVAQGDAVDGDRRGERVVVKPNISCRACDYCAAGREADCRAQTVIGVHRAGGAAPYVAVPARNAFGIGDLSFEVATAAVHSAPIALHAIRAAGGIEPGMTVLITGATGAVGSLAVQIVQHVGGIALAASTSRSIQGTGIHAIRYEGPDTLVREVRQVAPAGIDLALDTTGHGAVIGAAVQCLGWKGRLAVCSASLATEVQIDARAIYLDRLSIIGTASADYSEVTEALDLVASGAVQPTVGARFPLAEAHLAYEALSERSRAGKVVINVT